MKLSPKFTTGKTMMSFALQEASVRVSVPTWGKFKDQEVASASIPSLFYRRVNGSARLYFGKALTSELLSDFDSQLNALFKSIPLNTESGFTMPLQEALLHEWEPLLYAFYERPRRTTDSGSVNIWESISLDSASAALEAFREFEAGVKNLDAAGFPTLSSRWSAWYR